MTFFLLMLALQGEFVPDAVNVSGGVVPEEVRPGIALVEKLGRIFTSLAVALRAPPVVESVQRDVPLDFAARRSDPVELGGLGHLPTSSSTSLERGSPFMIFSWSLMIPSISISGRGGQPGTYMSTGTIWSTPWTIA